MVSEARLCFSEDRRTAHVEIRRAYCRNAIDFGVMEALERHLDELEATPTLTAVILSSEGDQAFVSGGDLKVLADMTDADEVRAMSLKMSAILDRFERLPALVIAAVDGDAYGGGAETLLACDLCIAHRDARIGFVQIRFAIIPGWGGATRLAERVGRAQAIKMLATAEIIDAQRALALGIVHDLAPGRALDAAWAFVEQISRRDPATLRGIKAALSPGESATRRGSFEHEREVFVDLWTSPAHDLAIKNFVQRRRVVREG